MKDLIKEWQDSLKKQGLEVKSGYYAPPEIKARHNYNLLKANAANISKIYNSPYNPPFDEDFKTQNSILRQIDWSLSNCDVIASSVIEYKKLEPDNDYSYGNSPYKTLAKNGFYDSKKAELIHNLVGFLDIGIHRANLSLGERANIVRNIVEVKLPELLKFAETMVRLFDDE